MLHIALALILGITYGDINLAYPVINDRFLVTIDTCIDNVTKSGSNYNFGGSMMCRCSENSVHCNYYDEVGCDSTSELQEQDIWGGCDQYTSGINKYMYLVEGCAAAQEGAALGGCGYYVDSGSFNGNLYDQTKPVGQCDDYNCGGTNNDQNSRSCLYKCDTDTTIEYNEYEDYVCSIVDQVVGPNSVDRCVTGTQDCAVKVTEYVVSDSSAYCGSKKSPFETSSSANKCNYIQDTRTSRPLPIGACWTEKQGYYSYSAKYTCSDDETYAELWHYLDHDSCGGKNSYLVENVTAANNTIVCDQKDCKGVLGQYDSCSSYNWDAYYTEMPLLWGKCLPLYTNPSQRNAGDNSLWQNQPWYTNLTVVYSCNLNKKYPSIYFFMTSDCSGDFIFEWNWYTNPDDNDYWNQPSTYGKKDCAYPVIKNCGNNKDSTTKSDIPSSFYSCSGSIRFAPFVGLFLGLVSLLF